MGLILGQVIKTAKLVLLLCRIYVAQEQRQLLTCVVAKVKLFFYQLVSHIILAWRTGKHALLEQHYVHLFRYKFVHCYLN